jgi:hypothetical protein
MAAESGKREIDQDVESKYKPMTYEIKVRGFLDDHWKGWFEGMELKNIENGETGLTCTAIIGPIKDQAALHGILIKIRDLNLTLISVRRLVSGVQNGEDILDKREI